MTSAIKAKAAALGFDLCGIARDQRNPKLARLETWIAEGRAGEMSYLAKSLDERLDPAKVLPSVRSVISLGTIYNTSAPLSTTATTNERAAIARYAWGDDYHDVIRERLRELLTWLNETAGPGLEAFSCVDNGPVQERVFAEQAGLGWIGKNTCVINPSVGSWFFLSEIFTNLDLEPDAPGVDQCGSCTRCLDACPTGAIVAPYSVDATRCISYLTIETRAGVDAGLRGRLEGRVFGCDICQDVCPWNRRAAVSDDQAWQARAGLEFPSLLALCAWPDDTWRATLQGSALQRAGLARLRRSLAYVAAGRPSEERRRALDALSAHPSAREPVVAEAIAWARAE